MHEPAPEVESGLPLRATPPYRLVVFDFDGTLADTFGWFGGVINDVADRFRFRRVGSHETERLRGMGARQIIRDLGIPAWKLPLISRHMHALMVRDIATIRLFEGVPTLLDELRGEGADLAVVSSNTEANIRAVLGDQAALIGSFSCGASLFGKARRLRALMKASGLPPDRILAIGDEIRDIEAAREAGCDCAAVAWGYTDRDALARHGPDFLFDDPAEIASMLRDRGSDRVAALQAAAASGHR